MSQVHCLGVTVLVVGCLSAAPVWAAAPVGPGDSPRRAAAPPTAPAAAPVLEPKAFRPDKKADKRVLIVTGVDIHKWQKTAPLLAAALDAEARLAVDVVETPAFLASPRLADYETIVLHFKDDKKSDPGPGARENLRKTVAEGGKGLVLVHFACGAFQGWSEFAKLAGRAWNPKFRAHDPRGTFQVRIADPDHPITKGMAAFETLDELYTCLDGDAPIQVLAVATSKVDKKDYPMAFVLPYGKGRVFHCVLGHDEKAFEAQGVKDLYRRGTAWAAGLALQAAGGSSP